MDEIKLLNQKIVMLEGQIAAIDARVSSSNVETWLTLLNATVNQLKSEIAALGSKFSSMGSQPAPIDIGGPVFMPDGNCSHTASDQTRTIEFQGGSGTHKNELQLVGVDDVANSSTAIPYIAVDSSGNGELAWAEGDEPKMVFQVDDDGSVICDWVRAT
jgi:hypothetical protein